jgi:predicted ATPase
MEEYPFTIPALRQLRELSLDQTVTILVGENGSGKSTLIEAIAMAAGFNAEGGSRNFNFATKRTESSLAGALRLVRGSRRPGTGFFLRAESFYNVATEVERLGLDTEQVYGGASLHQRSHGEAFLALAINRFFGNGLYILDEPEAALSPQNCLTFLQRMLELVAQGSQFIMATHSPLLMAYPGATIYELGEDGPLRSVFDDVPHVQLTRRFLAEPQAFLRHLG